MRRRSNQLMKPWKIPIDAEVAGQIEFCVSDPVTKQPRYGARTHLIEKLLCWWLDREAGKPEAERTEVPSLAQLRSL